MSERNEAFGKFPKDPHITLNQVRHKDRYTIFEKDGGKRAVAGVANFNINIREWIQWALDTGLITIEDPSVTCDNLAECLLLINGLNTTVIGSGSIATPWIISGYGIEPTLNANEYRVTRPDGTTFLMSSMGQRRRVKEHLTYLIINDSQQSFPAPLPGGAFQLSTDYYLVVSQGQIMAEGFGEFEWQRIGNNIVFTDPFVANPGDDQRIDIYYEYEVP